MFNDHGYNDTGVDTRLDFNRAWLGYYGADGNPFIWWDACTDINVTNCSGSLCRNNGIQAQILKKMNMLSVRFRKFDLF